MRTKHTPGPWRICEHSWSDTGIYDSNDENRICALSIYNQATEETQEILEDVMAANAQLIAAAPELLEALQMAVSIIRHEMHPIPNHSDPLAIDDCLKTMEEAITKATGGQS